MCIDLKFHIRKKKNPKFLAVIIVEWSSQDQESMSLWASEKFCSMIGNSRFMKGNKGYYEPS